MGYNAAIEAIAMPARIKALPISPAGFPVPFFVQWLQDGRASPVGAGVPDFRIIDSTKFSTCLHTPKCWICGQLMGAHRVFTIGPMCSINRVISEPPSHRECAEYAVRACPFMANPRMRRNVKDLPEHSEIAGVHLDRNPGTMCLWETRKYKPFNAGNGILFSLGGPDRVDWYALGKPATREQVLASIDGGYPELERLARSDGPDAMKALSKARERALDYLPAAV
jgi:hypothetical protein